MTCTTSTSAITITTAYATLRLMGSFAHMQGYMWGTEDGDLREVARFNSPTGIAYDEKSNTFYILDTKGRKIRTISMEK